MSRPIVKVCGATSEEEVRLLADLGVDFFGVQVDVPSPWAVSVERAADLIRSKHGSIRPTLVTRHLPVDQLELLIRATGVTAVQLGVLSLPKHVRQLRGKFSPDALTIIQEISYAPGRFHNEQQIDEYLAAGVDLILLDKLDKTHSDGNLESVTIPPDELAAFHSRHPGQPILVAGGINAENAAEMMAVSGAVGVDVCSSVRREGLIRRELVAQLMGQFPKPPILSQKPRPTLRRYLQGVGPGNHVIAYLTLGDPPDGFLDVAGEVLAAGALTLELGFPHPEPMEGEVLLASHHRALDAGVDSQRAMELLKTVAQRHPETPLVAVVQWPAIKGEVDRQRFLVGLVDAGAAAVLPVGVPLWQLSTFAARVHKLGLETVVACPPDASRIFRKIALHFCSGALYVPRGRVTGGAQNFNFAEFCDHVSQETDVPIVVGVGVKTAADVAEICRTPAKAAAVGSALVEHFTRGGSPGEFVRGLIS